MSYPSNADCWDCSNNHLHPVDGAITVFAYAAVYGHTPCQDPDIGPFNTFLSRVYAVASGVGLDPVYIFGFLQAFGQWPDLADPGPAAVFQSYLNTIGIRNPATGQLSHDQPGSPGGMIRPGPGDGYVGNSTAPATTDPAIAVRAYSLGAALPAQTGAASAVQAGSGTTIAAPAPSAGAPPPATGGPSPASGGSLAAGGTGSGDGLLGNSGGLDGSTSTSSTQTTTTAAHGQLGTAVAWVRKNPLEALAIAGGAYLLLFGVPSHGRR